MKIKEESPQTNSLSRCWFVLKKAASCLNHFVLMILTLIYKSSSPSAPTTVASPPDNKEKADFPSFSLLPNEILVDCLVRIPRSCYPKLSLVCKTFYSLILSRELSVARFQLRTQENVLHVCLQLPDLRLPSWFSLWIKPDQTLTNDMEEEENYKYIRLLSWFSLWIKPDRALTKDMEEEEEEEINKSARNTRLVGIRSSYYPRAPMFTHTLGSKTYAVSQYNVLTSSIMWVCNKGTHVWRKSPRMKVARENAVSCILDGKIYVMGGCWADESANWAEVFDTRTQIWESLPDPGMELRFSLVKKIQVIRRKLYVRSNGKKDYVYDPKEGKWDAVAKALVVERRCVIANVKYFCGKKGCLRWYDRERKEWRKVKGLATLNRNRRQDFLEIVNYGGKLLILWDEFADDSDCCDNKNIWCAVIPLETRNNGDEVWGKVEWASVVHTVPKSYVFLRGEVKPI